MTSCNPYRVIIMGAGPAGLATALSLATSTQSASHPYQITVLEVRGEHETLSGPGGAVNLTPLAMRYLDAIGAGARLRPNGRTVSAIELVSHRTGGLLGRLWPNVDALRVQRLALTQALLDEVRECAQISVVFGAKVTVMDDDDDNSVSVTYRVGHQALVATAEMLVGCDGLHSQVRSQLVDPARKETYSGKCVANGYATVSPAAARSWLRSDGSPLVTDTSLVSTGAASILLSYYLPDDEHLYLAVVMPRPEAVADDTGSTRAGWAVHGKDKAGLKRNIADMFSGGRMDGPLSEAVEACQEFSFYPVYMLPPGGVWAKGRAILLGDAAHGMPPLGESTGIAIEDGVLFAHVLSRRETRTAQQLFADYERLRRSDVDTSYKESITRWNATPTSRSWLGAVVVDWVTWGYVAVMNWRTDHFARDVRELALPA